MYVFDLSIICLTFNFDLIMKNSIVFAGVSKNGKKLYRDAVTGRYCKAPVENVFNIDDFMHGKVAINRVGRTVRFQTIDNNNPRLMIVSYKNMYGQIDYRKMPVTGRMYNDADSPFDLIKMAA